MITPAPTQRVTFAFQLCGDEHNMFPLWLNNTDSKHRQFGSGNALQRILWKKSSILDSKMTFLAEVCGKGILAY